MDNRSTILSTATRLFAEQGFAGVSLRAIAERVGITKPTLLYHFPSKDQLREEVLGTVFEHWATRLPSLLRAVTSREAEVEVLLDELWDFFAEDVDRARLIVRELLDRPEEMQARIAASMVPLVTLIAERMRKGISAGLLRANVDPEAFVLHMIGVTLASATAAPVLAPIMGGDAAVERQRAELRRIAHIGLFPDPVGESTNRATTGNVRSSRNG